MRLQGTNYGTAIDIPGTEELGQPEVVKIATNIPQDINVVMTFGAKRDDYELALFRFNNRLSLDEWTAEEKKVNEWFDRKKKKKGWFK